MRLFRMTRDPAGPFRSGNGPDGRRDAGAGLSASDSPATGAPFSEHGGVPSVVDVVTPVAAEVADPEAVDGRVLAGRDAIDPPLALRQRIARRRIRRRRRSRGRSGGRPRAASPGTRPCVLNRKSVGRDGPDRADVDEVPGVVVVDGRAVVDPDLGADAALEDAQLARPRDLPQEPDAARAEDAALPVEEEPPADRQLLRPAAPGLSAMRLA